MTVTNLELLGGAQRVRTRSDVLAEILRDAIEARIDRGALDRVLRRERPVRRELMERLS
jgi:hypothetical protein